MIDTKDIISTIEMIDEQNLDIRTITMGISLFDCVSEDEKRCADRVYDKITKSAASLVKTGEDIEEEFGIPIVNKRISVTPISLISQACGGYAGIARAMDRAAKEVGVNFVGGYSAFVQKAATQKETEFLNSIPEALSTTDIVCSSVNVATTRAGINMDAVAQMGGIIKKTAELTADKDGGGATKFVVFANAVEDNPFMAGAFHGTGEGDRVINVGVSGPGVVMAALKGREGASFDEVAHTIKKTAFQITRMGQLVAREASKRLNASFGIVDLSLAPTPAMGDSVAHILERMGLET